MIETQIVYVIGSADAPVKIGLASSLADRLESLQIGNPDALVCHHFVRVPARRSRAVEAAAHKAFADRHRRGEWFDVDWREAARLLDDLAELERDAEAKEDFLSILRGEYGMKAEGRAAVWDYLDRQTRGDAYVLHANGYILKRLGTAAYAAFSLVVAQQQRLSALSASEEKAAMRVLAQAINALCNFRHRYAMASNQKAALRDVRRFIDESESLRPRSLPPVRAA